MCNYKSAIVLRDESAKGGFKLLLSPWTESHSELCQIFKLNDKASARLYFARVEYSPKDLSKAHDISTYSLKLDEERRPEWWTQEIREDVAEKLKAYVKTIIVNDARDLLIGGQFVLGPKAQIQTVKECVINAMVDGSTVNAIRGGTVNAIRGGTVNDISGGTVNDIWGGTYQAKIGKIHPAATIVKDSRAKP